MTPSPLSVLIVGPAMNQSLGGQEVQAELSIRCWRDDPDVRATFVAHNPELPRGLRWATNLPVVRTVARVPGRALALWRAVRRAHIVHVFSASHSSFLLATLPAWVAARIHRKPTLVHYHSPRGHPHLQRSRLARAVLRASDAVVVPSSYLAEIFARFAVPTSIVANTIDMGELTYRPRHPLTPRLVCTRNFEPRYAVDLVVRAFAELKRTWPSAELLLAGQDLMKPAFARSSATSR